VDQYIVWSINSGGDYVTNAAPVSGASATIVSLETTFQQDLNGDGTIGAPSLSGTTIEAFGSTKLLQVGSNYYLISNSSGTGPELKLNGAPVVVGQFSGWSPIGTEQTSSGYQLVMKNASTDQYIVWNVDANGNYITNAAPVSGASQTIKSLEATFQQDLNGDGTLGQVTLPAVQAAANPIFSGDAFQFRADFGAEAARVEPNMGSVASPDDHFIVEPPLAGQSNLLSTMLNETLATDQITVADVPIHNQLDAIKLLMADMHAGFLFHG
jgi:hypothetical protein